MHAEHRPVEPDRPTGEGYERSDLSIKGIGVFGAALILLLALALFSMAWLFGFFTSGDATRQPVSPPAPASARSGPAQPLLQVDAPRDLKALRAAEEATLGSYGWVSKEAGIARIPIGRSMEILAERGLPAPASPAPTRGGGVRP